MEANGNGTNGGAPVSALPDGVATRLRHLTRHIPPVEIHDLWIFPPLPDLEGSSEFFLLARRNGGTALRVYSVRLPAGEGTPARRSADGEARASQEVVEHGSVPPDRLPRLVEGFRRRLGDEREPLYFSIGGCEESWTRLLAGEAEG